jgi:D-glycero-D-manno-heptose 1,7-bisphosphate phosphatase
LGASTTNLLLSLGKDSGQLDNRNQGQNSSQTPLDQEIILGARDAIASYKSQGWLIVGATNQGGVAAGHKQLEDAIQEQYQTLRLCPEITCVYFCPDYQGLHCWLCCIDTAEASSPIHTAWGWEFSGTYRKPGAGMLNAAIKNHCGFEKPEQILFVGDRDEDKDAAMSANIPFLWASDWWGSSP